MVERGFITTMACVWCVLADQEREWHDPSTDEPGCEPEYQHTRYSHDGDAVVVYKGQAMCIPHFNVERGWPAHGVRGPGSIETEIDVWKADKRDRRIEILHDDRRSALLMLGISSDSINRAQYITEIDDVDEQLHELGIPTIPLPDEIRNPDPTPDEDDPLETGQPPKRWRWWHWFRPPPFPAP